ncbi:MAG: two-component regulator propeller domain-containing protein [Haliscomenobacter sp.]|uniref:two-component regulator propeller domain-containing protein n=1 Tax=Haliscomenobacter sp. TaxID=2717303 RepID=UPI0029A0721B|nr:two-component regulator propeller domain-containing protein [Haliscomenobacter sp.]MDX2067147.1 two-component regulator propeller domain-containing protein [Haliscomenobacter sp.]
MQRIGILLLFLMLSARIAFAQEPTFSRLPEDMVVSNVAATAMYQDKQGFLWIGTWNGLYRYDGYNLKKFKLTITSPDEIKGEKIIALYEDREAYLWVGTENTGLYRLDRTTEKFKVYQHDHNQKNSLLDNRVGSIFQDDQGKIWVGTGRGLCVLNQDHTFTHQKDSPISNTEIVKTIRGRDGSYWFATTYGVYRGILSTKGRFSITRMDVVPAKAEASQEAAHNHVYDIVEDPRKDNLFWIATRGGLKRLDFANNQIQHIQASPNGLSNNLTTSIVFPSQYGDGGFFIGSDYGLNYYIPEKGIFKRYFHIPQQSGSLHASTVLTLCEDRVGQIWVGTNKGVGKMNFQRNPFAAIHFPEDVSINSMAYANNRVWAGSFGQGIFEIIRKQGQVSTRRISLGGQADFIHALHADKQGNIWAGTRGEGLIVFNADNPSQRKQYTVANGLSHNYLMSVWGDARGLIWIGSWAGGLIRHDPAKGTFHIYRKVKGGGNLDQFPIVLTFEYKNEAGENVLCVGTRGGGLLELLLDKEGFPQKLLRKSTNNPTQANTISSNFINCYWKDAFGRSWVGTEDGLNLWNQKKGTFKQYFKADGLPDDIIQSLAEDENGHLWVSSTRGLSRFSPEMDKKDYARVFDTQDGLPSNFFNSNVSVYTQDRHVFFGSNSGILYFQPHQIRENPIAPTVELVDFRLFNHSIGVGDKVNNRVILQQNIGSTPELVLRYNENLFSIEFAAMHFLEPYKNQYKFRLLGFNGEWIPSTAKERVAHFSNLSPGRYTFEVQAANNDGLWAKEPAVLKIRILPPFWLTWWAYLIYAGLIAGAILMYRQSILLREKLRNQVKMETFKREKTEELGQMKIHFFTNISHELRTPLTLLFSPLEDLLKREQTDPSTHEMYTLMYRNAERLKGMIDQLLEFRKIEEGLMHLEVVEMDLVRFFKNIAIAFRDLARHRNIQFNFVTSVDELRAWVDRDLLEKVLFNLLSNAFKYSDDGGNIQMKLESDGKQVIFSLEDDGIGISTEELPHIFEQFYRARSSQHGSRRQGTGIGLALAKSIVELHKGSIEAFSMIHRGSVFVVKLPLGKDHFPAEVIRLNYRDPEDSDHYPYDENGVLLETPQEEIIQSDNPLVLVVEDNADIRTYIRRSLHPDYEVIEAENGQEGLEKTRKYIPDIIISDVIMPEMDGFELCRTVKQEEATAHIPVILLSARSSQMYQVEGYDTGADDYISKPFSIDLMQARIRNLLNNRERIQRHFDQEFARKHEVDISPAELSINHLDKQFLEKCIALVEKHIENPDYSVEQMSHELLVSRMQLYRKIKAITGESPNHFIRTIRVKRAAQLLEKGYSVAETTYKVGFQDLKYFRECFKKQFGMNPSEFVQQIPKISSGLN